MIMIVLLIVLIHLFKIVKSSSTPLVGPSLISLPSQTISNILSFYPNFPSLSSVCKHFNESYKEHGKRLILERLNGFEVSEDEIKDIGRFIQSNFGSNSFERFLNLKREIKESSNSIRTRIVAFQVGKVDHFRFSSDQKFEFFGDATFSISTLKYSMENLDFETFSTCLPYVPMPALYDQMFIFIASNHDKLFPCLLEFLSNNNSNSIYPNFPTIYDYLSALIVVSAPLEVFLKVLEIFQEASPNLFSRPIIQSNFYDKIFEKIESDHQQILLESLINRSECKPRNIPA